jgi:hypothetical protein
MFPITRSPRSRHADATTGTRRRSASRIRQDRSVTEADNDEPEKLDRAGIAGRLGVPLRTVDNWIANSPANGFPSRLPGSTRFNAKAIDRWWQQHQQAATSGLTAVDRSGDPDELVTKAEASRIMGYTDVRHLDNSSVLPKLLARVDDETGLPSGGVRRWWKRSTVWAVADERTGRRGRPPGSWAPARGPIDRSGDPHELVGSTEAARVLGYARPMSLPKALLALADDEERISGDRVRRKWKRATLWRFADTANRR